MARIAEALALKEDLHPDIRKEWDVQSKAFRKRVDDLRATRERGEVAPETRKFCEADLGRHLEEATRAADRGTAEKAARGDAARILQWYLVSLAHFSLAHECLVDPTPAQEHALAGIEIVAQSLCNLIRREP